jgi:hypothetical protein
MAVGPEYVRADIADDLLAACEVRVKRDITGNIVAEPWHVVDGDGTIISSHAEPTNAIAAVERIRDAAIAKAKGTK